MTRHNDEVFRRFTCVDKPFIVRYLIGEYAVFVASLVIGIFSLSVVAHADEGAIVKSPVQDFLYGESGSFASQWHYDDTKDDFYLQLCADINGDGQEEVFLTLPGYTDGMYSKNWVVYESVKDGYRNIGECIFGYDEFKLVDFRDGTRGLLKWRPASHRTIMYMALRITDGSIHEKVLGEFGWSETTETAFPDFHVKVFPVREIDQIPMPLAGLDTVDGGSIQIRSDRSGREIHKASRPPFNLDQPVGKYRCDQTWFDYVLRRDADWAYFTLEWSVANAAGEAVYVGIGAPRDGYHFVTWDALDDAGKPVSEGEYIVQFRVEATDKDGQVSHIVSNKHALKVLPPPQGWFQSLFSGYALDPHRDDVETDHE